MRRLLRREQALLALALGRRPSAAELDAGLVGQDLQRLRLVEPVDLDEPVEDIALLAASPAVEGAAIRVDAERRRLLRVERAEPAVRTPGLA